MVLAAGVWGIGGTVRTTALGRGIIVREGSEVIAVEGWGHGRVLQVLVRPGDPVEAEQLLMSIDQRDLDESIRLAEERLTRMKADLAESEQRFDADLAAHDESTTSQLRVSEKATRGAHALMTKLQKRLDEDRALAEQDVLPRVKLLQQHEQVEKNLSEIADLSMRQSEIRSSSVDYRTKIADARATMRLAVEDQARKVAALQHRKSLGGRVLAPSSGFVDEVLVRAGEIVEEDVVLVTITTGGPGYELLAFLAADEGSRVTTGLDASINPTSVQRAQYGSMRGLVESISQEPVSPALINAEVRDDGLVKYFSEEGPPYMSRISLFEDATNASGFEWWSGKGTPFAITVGTLVDVEITIGEQAPITLLIPALRRALGIER